MSKENNAVVPEKIQLNLVKIEELKTQTLEYKEEQKRKKGI